MTKNSRDWRFMCFLALAVVCCFLLSIPFADLGFNDDWSYAHAALRYADTGQIEYNGWFVQIGLFQVPYAAALIRLFGFSFDLLRLGTLPFSIGCALLLYKLGRLLPLEPGIAFFGSLVLVTSPLFTPLSASFMTDVYSLFFMLACLYCGLKAVLAEKQSCSILWLTAAAAVGFAGGANRQIAWVAPIAVLLTFLWVNRARYSLVFFSLAMAAILAGGGFGLLRWFQDQPSSMYMGINMQQMLHFWTSPYLTSRLFLSLGLFLLPALIYALPAWRRIPVWYWLLIGSACALYYLRPGESFSSRLAPWMRNIVTPYGVLAPGEDLAGGKPLVLNLPVRVFITMAVFAVIAVWFFYFGEQTRSALRSWWGNASKALARLGNCPSWVLLFSLFCAGILSASTSRPDMAGMFDRYLLPVLPVLVFAVLRVKIPVKRQIRSAAGWAVLAIFALYGVAATHDYWAASRARLAAAALLQSAGVPRQHICGGIEYDGWTQLAAVGQIRNSTARPPAGTLADSRPGWMTAPFWFLARTPVVEPHYVLTLLPGDDLAASSFPPISYSAWLPPFQRRLWIMKAAANP